MRPPSIQHSTLRYPLDGVLGSPALVRLMRVLVHDVAGPVGVTEAATKAGLSSVGARRALENLARAGIATRVGTGRAQTYGLVDGNPYIATLRQLFDEEQRQYDDLVGLVRLALDMPEVRDAWADQMPTEPGEALSVTVVVETSAIPWIGREIRTRLAEPEKRFNLIIELAVFTRADAPTPRDGALVMWGSGAPGATDGKPGARSHAESTARSLRMAEAIADLIKMDPSLVRRAWQQTDRLLHEGQGMADSDIGEWRQILETYSPERVRDLLVATNSRAERLRRSSPFFAVLTSDERDRMMKELETER